MVDMPPPGSFIRALHNRARHGFALCQEGLWGKGLGVLYALAALYDFIRDDLWRPKDPEKWAILKLMPHLSPAWWGAGALAVLCVWMFEASFRITTRLNETIASLRRPSPLQIIFDPLNPGERFWSRGSVKHPTEARFVSYMEYRVQVANTSTKTIRNVRVSIEGYGLLPRLPEDIGFKKDGVPVCDIQPGHSELVPVLQLGPPQEGNAWGTTAKELHSPIVVIARGDDIPPASIAFSYHPNDVPALIESPQ